MCNWDHWFSHSHFFCFYTWWATWTSVLLPRTTKYESNQENYCTKWRPHSMGYRSTRPI